jgi:hypothetical protein
MTEQAISPLRRRMIEDMRIRKFAQKTQHDYVRRVKEFASYLKRSSPRHAVPVWPTGAESHSRVGRLWCSGRRARALGELRLGKSPGE